MFAIRENEYDITNFGTIVTVPNNPIARCMYYLNCVDTVLDIDEFGFLTDYAKYYLLDNSDKAKLLLLCKTLFLLVFLLLISVNVFVVIVMLLSL